ncbi:MAG: extracellular solute-binding protein, partial [Chloroflexia bacterium]|nr:extracellular solute-binding protein [Chloroflexia bacterium]
MSDARTISTVVSRKFQSHVSRRTLLKTGGAFTAASSVFSMPYVVSRSAAQSEPMVFWQFYSGGDNSAQAAWFEEMAQAWNDENEIKVQLEYIPGSSEDYYTKLSTAFAAGQSPDIFLLSPSDFLRYANNNTLQDLTPFLEPEAQADFYPDIMATRMVNDQILGLPMEVEPVAMFYSVKAFEEAGLSEADIPQTWEELIDVAEKLSTSDQYGLQFETRPGGYQVFMWYPWMWMGGGDTVTADGLGSNFNHPGTVQALELWQRVVNQDIAPREALGGGSGDVTANLAA